MIGSLCLAGVVQASPTGGHITAGSGSVTQTGNTTNVRQNSANLALDWQSFNVAANQVVNFFQPGATSIAINRILGNSGSQIFGHLNANGQVWLINPNGILFGAGAQVNVGGLIASTFDVSNAALGSSARSFAGAGTGSIVNEGTINASNGGYVALIGNQVVNQGVITARLGTVALGAGSAETLTFSGRELIHLKVDRSTLNNLAANQQVIVADGGQVIMTAGAQNSLLASVVNNTGIVQAHAVDNHNGSITLLAGMRAGEVDVSGTLDATAAAGGSGGSVETSGAELALSKSANVVAGPGGSWRIDPIDLTIDGAAATAIDNSLNSGTSVTEQTTATTASGSGTQAPGSGNINVNAALTWSNAAATLTLAAYNGINVNAAITGAGKVVMQASNGSVTIASGASIAGNAGVTLGAGLNFINLAGTSALSVGTGSRWLVYSTNPTQDTTEGLAPGFIQYAAAFGATPAQGSGNGFLYSVAPIVTVGALAGTVSKNYDGGTTATLTAANSNYTVSGLINGDNLTSMTGTYASTNVATSIKVTSASSAAHLTVATSGGMIPVYGYALAGSISANIGTITPATLSAAIVGNPTKIYDGTTTATLTASNYALTGFASGQSAKVNQPSSVAYVSASAGSETINATFANTNFISGTGTSLSNYVLPTSATGAGSVLQAPLTISGVLAMNKVYDATTSDPLSTINAAIYGVIGSDAVSLSTAGATGIFASRNAGTNIGVSTTGFTLTGAQQADYQLVQPAGLSATITPAALTITGVAAVNKVYNGNATDPLNAGSALLAGVIGSDGATLVLSTAGATGLFASPNVGAALPVSTSGFSLSGASALNYSLVSPTGLTANITPAPITIAMVGNPSKPYNGTTTASVGSANFTLSGFVSGEGATIPQVALAQYASPNAGAEQVTATLTGPDVAPTGATLLSNYTLPASVTGAGTITPAPLTGVIAGNPTKVYDSTTVATLGAANYTLYGFLAGQGATVDQTAGVYASANVGLQQVSATVTAANYTGTGATLLSNYSLPTVLIGAGNITPAPVTGHVDAVITNNPTKVYDGTTTAVLVSGDFVLSGFIAGQGATVTQTAGQYWSANVGIQPLNANLVAANFTANNGTNLSNYTLPTEAYGTGTVTAAPLTVSIVGDPTRVYNGSTNMVLSASHFSIAGFAGSEGAVVSSSATINYASANVGSENLLAALSSSSYVANAGTLLSNYVLATSASGVGNITPAPLYVTGVYGANKVYDTFTNDTLNIAAEALTGVVASDIGNVHLLGTAAGTFSTAQVGNSLAVTVSGLSIGGSASTNYTLESTPAVVANITPAPLSILGVSANSKPYDGTRAAMLNTAVETLSGVLGTDTVTLSAASALGTFGSTNVGNSLTVAASGFAIAGAQSGDYVLSQPSGLSANITRAPITALITGDPTKAYDGSSSTTLSASNYTLQGFAGSQGAAVPQSASAAYAAPDAGTNVTINSTLVLSDFTANTGTNLSNYLLPTAGTGTGTITPAQLSIAIVGTPTKTYDSTTAATLAAANYALSGFVGAQSASVTQTSGSYASPNAGTESVTAALIAANYAAGSGTNLNNYALPTTAVGPGSISTAHLTIVNASTTPQVYNGTKIDALTGATISGTIYGTDDPTLAAGSYATGTLANNGNVGTDAVTTTIALTGQGSANYKVVQPTGLTAVISQAPLAASSSATRIYDGTTSASLAGTNTTFTGFVSGQGATVNSAVTGTFAGSDVGSGIAITGGALTAGSVTANTGTLLSNYSLPATDNGAGTITPANVSITGTRSYDAATDAAAGIFGASGTITTGIGSQTLNLSGSGTLAGKNAGSETITSLGTLTLVSSGTGAAGDYTLTGGSVLITPAQLIYTASPVSQAYGTAPSGLSGAVTGLAGGETLAAVTTGIAVFTTSATSSSNVGRYAISGSGLNAANGNYTLTQAAANGTALAINPAPVSLSGTRTYDAATDAAFGVFVASGFVNGVNGETLTLSGSGTLVGKDVGSETISSLGSLTLGNGTGGLASNYALVSGSVLVTPAQLTYTATPASQAYGSAPSGLSGAVTGFVGGETVAAVTTGIEGYTTIATSSSNVGLYAITGSGLIAANGNYTFTQAAPNATALTINPANVSVSGTRSYDAATDAAFGIFGASGTVTGVNGETLALSGSGTLAGKDVGSEVVTSLGTLSLADGTGLASNYTLIGGSVLVKPAQLIYTASPAIQAYGTAPSGLSGAVTGFVGGETLASATAGAATFTTGATSTSNVGLYAITGTGLTAANYAFGQAAANAAALTINPAIVNLTGSRSYDAATDAAAGIFGSAGTVSGVNGETLMLSGTGSLLSKNAGSEPVFALGTLGLADGSGHASNYTLLGGTDTVAVSPRGITVTATGSNRAYDGSVIDAVTLGGVLAGDSVTFSDSSATFATKNVGTGLTVTIAGITAGGSDAGNYTLNNTTATTTANITPLAITVSGTGASKVYDGTVVDAATLASSGVLSGDAVTFSDLSATFTDKNVGIGKTVTVTGISAGGVDGGNYAVNATATSIADITPAQLTYTAAPASQAYGVTPAGSNGSVTGFVAGETLASATGGSAAFTTSATSSSNAGLYAVNGGGLTAANGNYTFVQAAGNSTALAINPAVVNLSGTRAYDAATDAAAGIFGSGGTIPTGIGSQTLTLSGTGTLVSKNVGVEAVSPLGTLSLTDGSGLASNYTLVGGTDTVTVSALGIPITVTATGSNRVYNGTVTDAVTLAGSGVLAGDSLTFSDSSATFANKNVGTGLTVTVAGITDSGTDAGNYILTNTTATTTANITPLAITVTGIGANKVYDGTVVDAAVLASSGVLAGDSVSFGAASATFASKNVGSAKTVTIMGISSGGADGGNYAVNSTAAATADITPAQLTYTATPASQAYGTTPSGLSGAVTGFAAGETRASVTTGTAAFSTVATSNSNVGQYAINGSGLSADNGNYTFVQSAANATAFTINPAIVNLSGSRTYDAATDAAAGIFGSSGTISSGVGSQTLMLTGSGTLASKNAGNEALSSLGTLSLASGTGVASNYTLIGGTDAVVVSPRAITVSATGTDRVYDGTVTDAVTLASYGVFSGDSLAFSDTAATFADKNVGNSKTVSVTGITDSGVDAVNYTLTSNVATSTANVTPATLTATANPATDSGGKMLPFSGALSGFVPGDTLANATSGTIAWSTSAPANPADGVYAIDATGLVASNYILVQALGNADALRVTARPAPSVTDRIYGVLGVSLTPDSIATPYGIGSNNEYGNNTGNERRDPDPTAANRRLSDFSGRLALTIVAGGMRLPTEAIRPVVAK